MIIIGGGFAGVTVLDECSKTFNRLLIDKKDYFEFSPNIVKSMVSNKPEKVLTKFACSKHKGQFVQANVTTIDFKNQTIFLELIGDESSQSQARINIFNNKF